MVTDDLFVLVPHQLFFFFKVFHDLPERLLEDLNLALEHLDLLLLSLPSLVILVDGTQLEHVLPLGLLVLLLQSLLLLLVIVECVPLCNGLLGELLVLQVDVLLDVKDVSFGISLCLLLEQL